MCFELLEMGCSFGGKVDVILVEVVVIVHILVWWELEKGRR